MVLLNNYEEIISELAVMDTRKFAEAVAMLRLQVGLRAGLHGKWVDSGDVDGHPAMDNVAVNGSH